uniref:Polyprotein P3 n=1 Tax=Cajanus cajan TaxID=3821 RepID=A0A151RTM3_CAJCA|nr:Polyprotein P3 [Cajanus cajan]
MVYNYKRLNDNTHIDGYTIPSKDVLINRIQKAKWFSKFDLKSGFHQVKMHPDSIKWTAFSCSEGLFEWKVMPKLEKRKLLHEKETPNTSYRTSSIKCFKYLQRCHIVFQCPTKKTMIMRGLKNYSMRIELKIEHVYPSDGDLLMIRRLLGSQSCEINTSQRENIFHTRCKILEQTCSLIIDNRSSRKCYNTRLFPKLVITTIPHPKTLQTSYMVVNQQVKVKFYIENYKDKVLCDVVPMEACHILVEDDRNLCYILLHLLKKFVLHTLTSTQVMEDQIQMKLMREKERNKKKNS